MLFLKEIMSTNIDETETFQCNDRYNCCHYKSYKCMQMELDEVNTR